MSTSTVSMWLNERPVIDSVRLSNRKQPTLPTAVRASGKRHWKEGTGWVWRPGCCLIGSCNSGGLVVMLRLCPLKHKQEGIQRAAPGPGSHRWPLWPVIMGSVVPSYPPAHYQSQTPSGSSVCVSSFVSTCTSSQLSTHECLLMQKLIAWKKRLLLWESQISQSEDVRARQTLK